MCPYIALWETAEGHMACRVLICAANLSPHEYAGMVVGYIGSGTSLIEPFHVRFERDQAKHLLIGDLNALTQKKSYSETWESAARRAIAQCRAQLRGIVLETAEGLWVATAAEQRKLKPLARDADCARSCGAKLDERVWTTISAHFGAPAGLESQ
jgi:hypothetical protein